MENKELIEIRKTSTHQLKVINFEDDINYDDKQYPFGIGIKGLGEIM